MSLTSFESYFGSVINASVPKSKSKKRKRQNNKKRNKEHDKQAKKRFKFYPQDKYNKDDDDNDTTMIDKNNNNNPSSMFDDNQNHTKISTQKLKANKLHRKNTMNSKKNYLSSNLISMGYDPKNMSLMKQKKLLKKAINKETNEDNDNDNEQKKKEKITKKDVLDFMMDNDLFIDDKNKKKDNKTKPKKKNVNDNKGFRIEKDDNLDLDFGSFIEPKMKSQLDEEVFIRTGKSTKLISDRQLLKQLKKRDKYIKRKLNKKNINILKERKIILDEHLTNNIMSKLKGKKVKNDLNYMKNKLKNKYKKKQQSRKKWKARLARKEFGRKKKMERRNSNIDQYRQKKINKRFANRITTQQAIAASNI